MKAKVFAFPTKRAAAPVAMPPPRPPEISPDMPVHHGLGGRGCLSEALLSEEFLPLILGRLKTKWRRRRDIRAHVLRLISRKEPT